MAAQIVPLRAVTLGRAAQGFLARRDLDADTLRRLRQDLGDDTPLFLLIPEQAAAVFTAAWDGCAASTWNRHRASQRSFTTWAADLAALSSETEPQCGARTPPRAPHPSRPAPTM